MHNSGGHSDRHADSSFRRESVIVLRGDLYSDTGYARATRALRAIVADHTSCVFGISLHEHGRRRRNAIDCPVVDDAELRENPFFHGAFVLNVCLPEQFVRVANAFNIGYFFWETEAMPHLRFWTAHMRAMDRLWAPSQWQSHFLQAATGRREIPVIPWPLAAGAPPGRSDQASLSEARIHAPMSAAELDNYLVRASPEESHLREKQLEETEHAAGRSSRFDPARSLRFGAVKAGGGDLFVAVQTDAPRKGLPLLLASWMQFKGSSAGRDARLVVKISALDVDADFYRIHFHASLAVRRAARRCGIEEPGVWFLHDRLSAAEMRALLRAADAFVTATMGEGFGGPIAEALIEGTPVISPRHTSIVDLLCASYPLTIASEPHRLALWNNIDVYSAASQWHVVDDASFVGRLQSFVAMSDDRRRDIARRARSALLAHAGHAAVDRTLKAELERCAALRRTRDGTCRSASLPLDAGMVPTQALGAAPC